MFNKALVKLIYRVKLRLMASQNLSKSFLLAGVLFSASVSSVAAYASESDTENETEQMFIQRMVDTHGMDKATLEKWFSKATKQQRIIDSMNKPAESLPWHKYRKIFVRDSRIKAGVEFWNKYHVELKRAEATFNVPASMIVGIIGVETFYGRIQGNLKVWDALYTLGFHYPKRGRFFRGELEQYLLLVKEQNWDFLEPQGSYAGAMGMGQFIPTSYREYAVDFDGDGKIDLFNNPIDAIGSVANYFRRHKWRWGEPVAYPVVKEGEYQDAFEPKRMKPRSNAGAIKSAGYQWKVDTLDEQSAAIYHFEQPDHKQAWIIFDNFYVITRYNRSPLYALAVVQFSQEVVASRAQAYWNN
ncbi:membrane-bound lytic murein transglycosylase B [Pleionea mediterranea]|uniref:Membrane-bound lytic murein transglycosylase B n=1 Tax=Pleionea mediterranea TaxID=523701 RepID=A0A316FWK8_9GAMM|nr:membrane-bound lytic murein transglycosylase B [Pleionea mediterranea]